MLQDLFAKWMSELPGFILVYLIAFGVRLGSRENPTFQIHGVVTSLWVAAQGIVGIRDEHRAEFKAVKESQVRIEGKLDKIERNLEARDESAVRFSFK